MSRTNKNLILCLIFILSLTFASLMMYKNVWAADDEFDFGDSGDTNISDTDSGDDSLDDPTITDEDEDKPSVYFDDDPKKDANYKNPFTVLVKKAKPVRHIPIPDINPNNQAPQKVVIPPLNVKVTGIVTSGKKKLVLLTFDGEFMSMFEGDSVPNKFKLTEINDNSITIYENQRQSRRTIKLQ